MLTFDFREYMDKNAYWYEDVDTSCPFCEDGMAECETCDGEGEVDCQFCGGDGRAWNPSLKREEECPVCDGAGKVRCEECDDGYVPCEKCNGAGDMEIMWNYGFIIERSMHPSAWDTGREIAAEYGFVFAEIYGMQMILMCSCGYDNTWGIGYTKYLIQGGWLCVEDCQQIWGNQSARVFIPEDTKKDPKFLEYLEKRGS